MLTVVCFVAGYWWWGRLAQAIRVEQRRLDEQPPPDVG